MSIASATTEDSRMTGRAKRPLMGRVLGVGSLTTVDGQLHIEGELDGRRVLLSFASGTIDPGIIAKLGGPTAITAARMRSLARTLLAAAERLEMGRQ
jgi:hypothetical protein